LVKPRRHVTPLATGDIHSDSRLLREKDRPVPEKKVTAATVAAALVTIVVWVLRTFADVEIPAEVAVAISTVLVAIAGYFAPHTHRPDLAAPSPATPKPSTNG
jgi:hypothetical protein